MRRALLLEDDPVCTIVARAALRAAGFAVVEKTSEKGARGACLARFDLYLVDGTVRATESGGEGSGLAFARWLRELRPKARIVIWTGQEGLAEEAQALGATVVVKGDAEALRAAIRG